MDATTVDVRASDAEREAVAAELRRHTVDGRLTIEEFLERLDEAFAAKTRRDLERVLRELPPSPPPSPVKAAAPPVPSWPVAPFVPLLAIAAMFLFLTVAGVWWWPLWALLWWGSWLVRAAAPGPTRRRRGRVWI
jgi:hypothetical protein